MEQTNIKVGTVGTQCVGSDRYAMVVVDIVSPKRIKVSHMLNEDYRDYRAGRIDGEIMVERTDYNRLGGYCEPQTFSLRKNGRWYPMGSSSKYTGAFYPGEAENYRDPSF